MIVGTELGWGLELGIAASHKGSGDKYRGLTNRLSYPQSANLVAGRPSSPSLPPNEKHVPTIHRLRRHLRRWNPVKPNKTVAVRAGAAEFSVTFLHGLLFDLAIM